MSITNDYEFLKRREKEERKRAGRLDDACAKIAHRELANEYSRRASVMLQSSAERLIDLVAEK